MLDLNPHSDGLGEFYLLGYNVVYSGESTYASEKCIASIFRVEYAVS
jgi:hypothetical protein